jgi:XTP/dITP diphosphohydrolase
MHKILSATYNKSKYAEFAHFFTAHGFETAASYQLEIPDVEEGVTSFAENAKLKAMNAMQYSHLPSLGDDSGLEIPELDNFPGVVTARFTKDQGGYPQAVEYYCNKLSKDRFAARYVAELCLALPNGDFITTRETLDGELIRHPRGDQSFGYDAWFVPEGLNQTCGEISRAEKEVISHRGKAVKSLLKKMEEYAPLRLVS